MQVSSVSDSCYWISFTLYFATELAVPEWALLNVYQKKKKKDK